MIYRLFRPLLFLFDPETAHKIVLQLLKLFYRPKVSKWLIAHQPSKPIKVFGLEFPNRIGLSAGLDKNADYMDALLGLGFGFIEVGTVTPKPQKGNPTPRLFRLTKADALINRMGFNNKGVKYLVERLKNRCVPGIVGVNIGKNLVTALEDAIQDYDYGFECVYPYADYVTINISSPNTPNLRKLQTKEYLGALLQHLKAKQKSLSHKHQRYVPLLIKISPDLSEEALNEIILQLLKYQIDGVIAANASLRRINLPPMIDANQTGGLSGRPLFANTLNLVTCIHKMSNGQLPIIAVGGILSADDVMVILEAGASLVQIYTGLIYEGPQLVRSSVRKSIC